MIKLRTLVRRELSSISSVRVVLNLFHQLIGGVLVWLEKKKEEYRGYLYSPKLSLSVSVSIALSVTIAILPTLLKHIHALRGRGVKCRIPYLVKRDY